MQIEGGFEIDIMFHLVMEMLAVVGVAYDVIIHTTGVCVCVCGCVWVGVCMCVCVRMRACVCTHVSCIQAGCSVAAASSTAPYNSPLLCYQIVVDCVSCYVSLIACHCVGM